MDVTVARMAKLRNLQDEASASTTTCCQKLLHV